MLDTRSVTLSARPSDFVVNTVPYAPDANFSRALITDEALLGARAIRAVERLRSRHQHPVNDAASLDQRGRARGSPGQGSAWPAVAPTIYLADTDLRLGVPAILQRVTQSTSDLHGHTTHAVGRVPIQVPMPDGQHSAIARGPRCFARLRTATAEFLFLPCPLAPRPRGRLYAERTLLNLYENDL